MHNCQDLVSLFNATFMECECTQLQAGGNEPIYRPAQNKADYHCIVFTQDYYASALHEIAHWGIAGAERRLKEDYGYWYTPDGRTLKQQSEFELVEVRPQALEWILSEACGFRFRISADNVENCLGASGNFKDAIYQQVLLFCKQGLNVRMNKWVQLLLNFYQPTLLYSDFLDNKRFQRDVL